MDRLFALISLRVEIFTHKMTPFFFNQQKLYLQMSALKDTGVREDRIFTDMMTGSTDSRDGLKKLLAKAEKDDTIISSKMDRMARNTADMINIVDRCYKKGITIKFLENGLSTEGTMGKMIIQILAAVAEAERERILERTNDGRQAAMDSGVKFGRKPHPKTELGKMGQKRCKRWDTHKNIIDI